MKKRNIVAIAAILVTLAVLCGCSAPQEKIQASRSLPTGLEYHLRETQVTVYKHGQGKGEVNLVAVYKQYRPPVKARLDLQIQWETHIFLVTQSEVIPFEIPRGYSEQWNSTIRSFAADQDGALWAEWELNPRLSVGAGPKTLYVSYGRSGGYYSQSETRPKLATWDYGDVANLEKDGSVTILGRKLKF